jgi:purine-binding chemotaxis protein CheW
VPIEVPDTRAFADPPPRRRRPAAAKPAPAELAAPLVPEQVAVPAQAPVVEQSANAAAEPASAFRKPVRRRRAVAVEDEAVAEEAVVEASVPVPAEVGTGSAFSRPVRRRPRTAAAPVPAAVVVPVQAAEAAHIVEPAEPMAAEPAESVVLPAPIEVPAPVVVEERRGTEGVADELAAVTDTVVVRLGGTRYAVAMEAVAEVGRPPHVTRVPGVPAWIAGVANWRGRIMPVLDLRILLGAPTPELGIAGRIMVLSRDGITLAFLAERVEGVVSLELDSIEPVLLTLSRTTASVLAGQLTHPDGPIAVLDLDVVFGLRSTLPRVRRAG